MAANAKRSLKRRHAFADGTLVKSIINEVVTYYVSKQCNVKVNGETEEIQKFNAFGSQTIAVRTLEGESSSLNWILWA